MKNILLIISIFITLSSCGQSRDTTTVRGDTIRHAYIVIPQAFVNKYNDGKLKRTVNQFHAVKTKDNRWVVSVNALNEFEDVFGEVNVTKANIQSKIIWLTPADFHKQTLIQ